MSPRTILWLLGGITIVGLALRLPSFDDSLWGDEVTTYGIVSGHGPREVFDLVRTDLENTPPLFYMLAWATERLGGPEGLRLTSLLAGVAAIPLTYLLGVRTVGRPAALVGAGVIAITPFLIYYSTQARAYALVLTLALLSTLALLQAIERGGARWWIAYAACTAAVLLTQYTAAFALLAQFAWASAAHPGARRALTGASALAVLPFLLWLPGFLEDRDSPTNLYDELRPLTLQNFWDDVSSWAIGHPVIELTAIDGRAGLALVAAGLVLGAVGLAVRLRRAESSERPRPSPGLALVIALCAAVPVGAALYSLFGSTVWTPRNLIASSPGLALVIGALLTAGPRVVRVGAVALCLGGLAIGAARMLDADRQRPDYEGAVEFIESFGPPGSAIAEATVSIWGPQTALEAALGPPHDSRPGGHPVLQIDPLGGQSLPSLATRHQYVHAGVPILVWASGSSNRTPADQAGRVGRLAAGGSIFFVGLESAPAGFVDVAGEPSEEFVQALPAGYRLVEEVAFPGFRTFKPHVYVFKRGPVP